MSMEERSKEERSELKCKLENMEEKDNPQEVNISIMSNLHTETPTATAQDEQSPLESFEEVTAGEFNEMMVYDELIIKYVLKMALTFMISPSHP